MKKSAFKLGMPSLWLPPKILLIMKLIIIIMTTFLIQVSAAGLAQTVTLQEKNASLRGVLTEIRRQTGYDFIFDAKHIENAQKVNLSVSNLKLEIVLNELFKDQNLSYSIKDKFIVLEPKKETIFERIANALKRIDVRGRIVDDQGNPIANANVVWVDGKKGYVTNANGEFYMQAIDEGAELTISYVGYNEKKIKALQNLGNVILELSRNKLDDIQVIGYGTTTRRFNVGASYTVNAAEIEKQPVNNLLLALQGRVPGLIVTPNGGAPGASARVQIRGQGTLKGNVNGEFMPYDQPLFIIDGIPFAPQNNKINLTNSLGGNPGQGNTGRMSITDGLGPFNSINPADIESITVLKDADATSIYGTQGANGVILITTKKGKAGDTKIDFRLDRSVNVVARPLKMLNTDQYLDLRRRAIANDQVPADMINGAMFPDLYVFDQTKYTNWYQSFFDRNSNNLTANASISGGSDHTTFIFNTGYSKNEYNFPGDYADQRYSFHSSIQHSALNNRLNFNFGADYSYNNNNSSGNPNVGAAFTLPPNTPDLIDPSGNLVWNYKGTWLSNYQQYAYLKQTRDLQSHNLNTNLRIGYDVLKGLKISTVLGYSRFNTDQNTTEPRISQTPQYYNQSTATFAGNAFQTISVEPQIDYNYTSGRSRFTALLGGAYKKNLYNSNTILGFNYSSDALLGSINGASSFQANDEANIYKYAAAFGRLNYIYDEKYIINLTGRRDGSSNFGPNRQFGNFGSAGLGWIFSEENGFKTLLPFISYAKLSGSYGTSGTDGVAPYQYQSFWKTTTNTTPFQGVRPLVPGNLYNPDYTWSVKRTLNLGLDFSLFKNRLLFNVNWYRSRNDNQLGSYTLPAQTGFNAVLQNFDASIENTGLEFTLSSDNVQSENFRWTSNFNISLNRNKLIAFPGLDSSPYALYYTLGKSVNTVKGYIFNGVNRDNGLFEYRTASGVLTSTPAYGLAAQGGDMTDIGDLQPKFSGGLGNTFSYKGFSLMAFFQFTKQASLNYLAAIYSSQNMPGGFTNLPVQALNYWKNPGDDTKLQKVGTGFDYNITSAAYAFPSSSGAYSDASYIRLKTLSLDYRLPDQYLARAGVKNLRIFVNAQNLLTITGYEVGDPESAGSLYVLPLQRTIAFGLSFNF